MFEHIRHRQTDNTIWIVGIIIIANIYVAKGDIILAFIWIIFGLLLILFNILEMNREFDYIRRKIKWEEHLLKKLKGGKKKE